MKASCWQPSLSLKANAAVLAVTALIGTMDAVTLGHALAHFHVPQKLTQLMLFMVRYFDVLGREYARLRAAMRVRCFRPAMNRHSYRTFGYLVGMLLVRSFDRSERVLAAMKCRGFCGRYYMLDHFAFVPRRDGPFYAAMSCWRRSSWVWSGYERAAGRVSRCRFRLRAGAAGAERMQFFACGRASAWPCWGPTAAARPRSCT